MAAVKTTPSSQPCYDAAHPLLHEAIVALLQLLVDDLKPDSRGRST